MLGEPSMHSLFTGVFAASHIVSIQYAAGNVSGISLSSKPRAHVNHASFPLTAATAYVDCELALKQASSL